VSSGGNSGSQSRGESTRGRLLNRGDGRGLSSSSSSSRQRSVEEILDLDDKSFLLDDDDVDGLMDSIIPNNSNNNPRDVVEDLDTLENTMGEGGFDYLSDDDEFDPLSASNEYDDDVGGDGLESLMGGGVGVGGGEQDEYGQGSEKGALYDAYNLLHSLAQVRERDDGVVDCCCVLMSLVLMSHFALSHAPSHFTSKVLRKKF
jgi:hypothetical protein